MMSLILLLVASERALESLNLAAAMLAKKWCLIFLRSSRNTGIRRRWAQTIHLERALAISSGLALSARRKFSFVYHLCNLYFSNKASNSSLPCSAASPVRERVYGPEHRHGDVAEYEGGQNSLQYSRTLGCRRGPDGRPEIDPEEAETIRYIYRRYLEGGQPR